ncbi:hypothetical protein NDU88_004968 [Pleurodeles waltl]|uniref:Uncharacterized protein n=1 Tax=Pleurodeles waltl TaxID=8319 RepID=A0AAV7WZT9_PLEWA|nr:hypothetical protein NDU88_004968 [Pleurodeles waltl]
MLRLRVNDPPLAHDITAGLRYYKKSTPNEACVCSLLKGLCPEPQIAPCRWPLLAHEILPYPGLCPEPQIAPCIWPLLAHEILHWAVP